MADILFVTWDGGGDVPPALGIAQRAAGARPCRAVPRARRCRRDALRAKGYDVRCPTGTHAPFSGSEHNSPAGADGGASATAAWVATCSRRWRRSAGRPGGGRLLHVRRSATLPATRACATSSLEHPFDDYYERSCLRGPLGLSLRLRRLAPRRALDARPGHAWWRACPSSTRLAAAPQPQPTSGRCVDVAPRVPGEPDGAGQPQHLRLRRHAAGPPERHRRDRRGSTRGWSSPPARSSSRPA